MKVLENDQQRSLTGERSQQAAHRLEHASALEFGRCGLVTDGPQQPVELGDQRAQRPGPVADRLAQPIGMDPGHHGPHHLHHRLQEQRALGLVATRLEHQRSAGLRQAGELGREPGLADSGLSRHQHAGRRTANRRRPLLDQHRQLRVPADEAGVATPLRRSRCRRVIVDSVASQNRQVDPLRLRPGIGAQLLDEHAAEPFVRRQGLARLPELVVGAHHGPVGFLVKSVGGDRIDCPPQRPTVVPHRRRRPPRHHPGAPQQALGLPPRRSRPVGVQLVLKHHP